MNSTKAHMEIDPCGSDGSAECSCKGELSARHALMEDILLSMPHGVVIIDPETHEVIDLNPQSMMMLGMPRDRVVGRKCHRFICSTMEGRCPITDMGKEMDRSETELLSVDGSRIPVLKTVIRANLNGQEALIESFVDLTEQKEAERLRAEGEKFRGVLEMAGTICHEFNQPLMALSGFAELMLLQAEPNSRMCHNLEQMREQIDRMGRLTRKLMNLTTYRTKHYLNGLIVDIDASSKGSNMDCGV